MKTKHLFTLAGSVVAVLAVAGSRFNSIASAAIITWGTPTTISSASDVSLNGTLERAINYGGLDDTSGGYLNSTETLNGVTFTTANTANPGGTSFIVGSTAISAISSVNGFDAFFPTPTPAAPFSGLPAAYQGIIGTGVYINSGGALTLTLNGLNVGYSYELRVWVNNWRAADGPPTTAERTAQFTAGNSVVLDYNVGNADNQLGQFVIGVFTTDAIGQSMLMA